MSVHGVVKEHRIIVTGGNLLLIDVVLNSVQPTPLDVSVIVHNEQWAAHAGIRSKIPVPAPWHPRHLRFSDQDKVGSALVPAFLLRANRMANLQCMQRQRYDR